MPLTRLFHGLAIYRHSFGTFGASGTGYSGVSGFGCGATINERAFGMNCSLMFTNRVSMADSKNPLPLLSSDDYAALKASVARDGFLYPVIRSAGPALQGEVVDGFNREKIGKELGLEPPRISRRFETEAEFRIAQIDANIARRQLTLVQRVQLAMAREPWERRLAAHRQREGQKQGGVAKSRQKQGTEPAGGAKRATAQAAEAVGLKRDTYEHARFVLEKAPPEIRESFVGGKLTVDRAWKATRQAIGLDSRSVVRTSVARRFGAVPRGKFGAVVLTPPWRVDARKFEAGHVVPAEVAAIDVRALTGENGVIAITVPTAWFGDVVELVVKTWRARPYTWLVRTRGESERAELVLVCTTGKAAAIAPTAEHVLGTPAQFFGFLDRLVPDQEGIVLFGDVERAGWTSWSPTIK